METVQQNGRFTLFSIKFLSIYSILYEYNRKYKKYILNIKQFSLDPLKVHLFKEIKKYVLVYYPILYEQIDR